MNNTNKLNEMGNNMQMGWEKNKRNEMAAVCANVKPTFSNTAWIREYIENSNL
jgi:hypothetical protein